MMCVLFRLLRYLFERSKAIKKVVSGNVSNVSMYCREKPMRYFYDKSLEPTQACEMLFQQMDLLKFRPPTLRFLHTVSEFRMYTDNFPAGFLQSIHSSRQTISSCKFTRGKVGRACTLKPCPVSLE